jgi:hypothetical protein
MIKNHLAYALIKPLLPLVIIVLALLSIPPAPASQIVVGINPSVPFSHTLWDATLSEAVSADGWVDFSLLKAFPRVLNAYLQLLAQVSPHSHLAQFKTPQEKAAYWVNAHNALLLKLTLDNYPTQTAHAKSPALPYWKNHYKVGGVSITLDEIKAKAQAAGVAAGVPVAPLLSSLTLAGPSLRNEAYLPEKLTIQAQSQQEKPLPYAQLRQAPQATCTAWIIKTIDQKNGTLNRYKPNARLPISFPLPVPRPVLETTVPYSEKGLFHYCQNPTEEAPPDPLLLMDKWQLVP